MNASFTLAHCSELLDDLLSAWLQNDTLQVEDRGLWTIQCFTTRGVMAQSVGNHLRGLTSVFNHLQPLTPLEISSRQRTRQFACFRQSSGAMKIPALVSCLLLAVSSVAAEGCGDASYTTTTSPSSTPAPTTLTSSPSTPAPTTNSIYGSSGSDASAASGESDASAGETVAAFTRFFNASMFAAQFPEAVSLYTFQGLVDAVSAQYPSFSNSGDDDSDKRELAAFLAQLKHESDNFKAPEEYAAPTYNESQYCDTSSGVPCIPGRRYHGRGPIMLSWNYNYFHAGEALGIDLLSQPELVATDSAIAWETGLWYWMTPQKDGLIIHDVVTKENGFAQSTYIINGALECGGPNVANEAQRIRYFEDMCTLLDVQPLGNVSCNA